MFEEIEARAYKNLRGDIQDLINRMIQKMCVETVHSHQYAEKKWYTEAEYHAGYHDAVSDTLDRIINIIDTIDNEVAEQIDEEDRKFAEEMPLEELAADFAPSKML